MDCWPKSYNLNTFISSESSTSAGSCLSPCKSWGESIPSKGWADYSRASSKEDVKKESEKTRDHEKVMKVRESWLKLQAQDALDGDKEDDGMEEAQI